MTETMITPTLAKHIYIYRKSVYIHVINFAKTYITLVTKPTKKMKREQHVPFEKEIQWAVMDLRIMTISVDVKKMVNI